MRYISNPLGKASESLVQEGQKNSSSLSRLDPERRRGAEGLFLNQTSADFIHLVPCSFYALLPLDPLRASHLPFPFPSSSHHCNPGSPPHPSRPIALFIALPTVSPHRRSSVPHKPLPFSPPPHPSLALRGSVSPDKCWTDVVQKSRPGWHG